MRRYYVVQVRHAAGEPTDEAGPFSSRAAARRELSRVASELYPNRHQVADGKDGILLFDGPKSAEYICVDEITGYFTP